MRFRNNEVVNQLEGWGNPGKAMETVVRQHWQQRAVKGPLQSLQEHLKTPGQTDLSEGDTYKSESPLEQQRAVKRPQRGPKHESTQALQVRERPPAGRTRIPSRRQPHTKRVSKLDTSYHWRCQMASFDGPTSENA